MSDLDKEELEATRNMGKTANELSEKEIIQHFEFIKSGIKEETKFIDISILEYFEGLLDLYNKEKEKNKILELAKIPYLKGEIMAYKENTVSKDKIKEIIYPTPTNPISYEIQSSDIYKKLLELLEEK